MKGDANINIPKVIYFYDEGVKDINLNSVANFIKKNLASIKIKIERIRPILKIDGLLLNILKTREDFRKRFKTRINNNCHIIFTPRLFATYAEDKRLHIRMSVYSLPSIISLAGIVEGPARPKEYYILKRRYARLGVWDLKEEEAKRKIKGRFLDYNDPKILEVIKGLTLQALFFYFNEKPFCPKKICRLFNAHTQEDLIYSQITHAGLCKKHKNILRKL